jgi:eukaryotic-like serine/threonine-protein kinase
VITITNIDSFLSLKLKQISSGYNSEEAVLYRSFYNDIKHETLREIFAIIHCRLNSLFSFMNYKNSPGFGGHYNAEESRELIELIRQIRVIQATLRDENSEFYFEIDSYYEKILTTCRQFLSGSGGSSIPKDFPEINIIEHKPIFTLVDFTVVQGPKMKSTVRIKLIGEGSYAKVFKYRDPYYNCDFAIKRANEDLRPDELERFRNEYKILKTLDSPFIIKAYHYNEEKNEYTMELADQTLEKFISRNNNSIPFDKKRALVIQLLNAFEYIHSKGILHRDISYQNILIKQYDDGSLWVKVTDFGLVKLPESTLTRQGTKIKGAINDYSDLMAIGFENYEIRHETYALAQVIYFILTGRKAGRKGGYTSERNNELKNFILRAVSADKEKRFTSVREMKEELLKVVIPSLKSEIHKN